MPRAVNFTRLLLGILIPLCIWGMIATLLLQVVALRTVFVGGGEGRLRQGLVAFALGVVLIEKLRLQQGRSAAILYGFFLGAAISLFSLVHAIHYRMSGIHPMFVFVVNQAFFALLWWAGMRITRACSSDAESAGAALDSGIMNRRVREVEMVGDADPFTDRLPSRHPGRVIFHFSLVAIPIFGLGVYLVATISHADAVQVGALLFIYLLCAFLLLALSSLGQLVAYFAQRDMALPDQIGLSWIAVAVLCVSLVLLVALALPQPASPARSAVRNQIVAVYRGAQSKHGMHDTARVENEKKDARRGSDHGDTTNDVQGGKKGQGEGDGSGKSEGENGKGGKGSGKGGGNDGHGGGGDAKNGAGQRQGSQSAAPQTPQTPNVSPEKFTGSLAKVFRVVVVAMAIAVIVAIVILTLAMLAGLFRRLSHGLSLRRILRLRKERANETRKRATEDRPLAWRDVPDPFGPGAPDSASETARICWMGLLAYCSDRREPCPAETTPFEFVGSRPQCLRGFENEARRLAEFYTVREFSSRGVSENSREELRRIWTALKRKAES